MWKNLFIKWWGLANIVVQWFEIKNKIVIIATITYLMVVCNPFIVKSQTIEATFEKAIQSKNADVAIPLLERCLYFTGDDGKYEILSRLGDCFLSIDSLTNAYLYYNEALNYATNDSLFNEIIIKMVSVCIKQHKTKQALDILESKLQTKNSTHFIGKKYYYIALVDYQLHDYKASEIEFYNCFKNANNVLADSINFIFKNLAQTKFYNPKKAKTLSRILPGLGQLYVKDYKNSINSFGLNAGLVGLGIWSAIVYTPFDGIVWVAPWLRRYYIGGYKKAELLAIKKNDEIENAYLKLIVNKIEKLNKLKL